MRVLLWGIVALVGLGLALQALGVHGSKDERPAIRHAVRAPFLDLQRRDAAALCEDFTPAVEGHLAAGQGADCRTGIEREFRLTQAAAQGVRPGDPPLRLKVMNISWHGKRATADSIDPASPGDKRHWQLNMLGHRWRIATSASLEARAQCQPHVPAEPACPYVMSMRFAGS